MCMYMDFLFFFLGGGAGGGNSKFCYYYGLFLTKFNYFMDIYQKNQMCWKY